MKMGHHQTNVGIAKQQLSSFRYALTFISAVSEYFAIK